MANVLITGGTGLIGRHLSDKLLTKGFNVAILSRQRNSKAALKTFYWNLNTGEIDKKAIEWADYIIHLAGVSIGDKRWTKNRKQLIKTSRTKTGELLFNSFREHKKDLKAFISASAIGYYGAVTTDSVFTEKSKPAKDFLGSTCKAWEETADKFQELGIRTVKIRTGLVLTERGGALSKMITPIKWGIGSAIGSGKQYLPWIHIDDLCGIYIKALEDVEFDGAYNAVAPESITNKEFIRALAKVLKKPFWFFKVPSATMKLLFGEMSNLILKGSKVSAAKVEASGYKFLFPNLKAALIDLMKKK